MAKHRQLIEKISKILASNEEQSFLVEGPRDPTYEDLWNIRAVLFSSHSSRFRFKKQFNGVWVEILPTFNPVSLDLWDGESIESELSRGAIGAKLLLDKPNKIRFLYHAGLVSGDLAKLETLSIANSYSMTVDEKWVSFTKQTE